MIRTPLLQILHGRLRKHHIEIPQPTKYTLPK
jgi:hypothetical protein